MERRHERDHGPAGFRTAPPSFGDRRTPPAGRTAARPGRGDQRFRSLREPSARGFRRRVDARRGARTARHPSDVGEAEERHHPEPVAGHFLRPLDQPLSRLRARLLLLLRPADPRLHGPFGWDSTSRPGCSPSRASRRCSRANSRRQNTRLPRSRSAPTPIPTSRSSGSTGSPGRCWKPCNARAIRRAS